MDYTDLEDMLQLITERLGHLPSDAAALLESSAARDCSTGEPHYRPYYVLGLLMVSAYSAYKRVRSAAGSEVEWATPYAARRSLWDLQSTLDADLCDVPAGITGGDRFRVVM